MSDDRTPPAQLAAGGATVPAGAGYAPAHQDDHDTDGGHDPAGKFVNAVQNFLAANKYKRDLDNVQVRGLAENMPPPPANIVTEWYAKSEEERRNPGHEKKSSGKDEAPPLHPVMIALLMQEARKKAEAAGKTAAGVLGADVIIDGRPDLDERKPAVEKKADWWDKAKVIGRAVTTTVPIAPLSVAGPIGAANYIRNNGSRIVEKGVDSVAGWEPGTTRKIVDTATNDVPRLVKTYEDNKDVVDTFQQYAPVFKKHLGKGGKLNMTPDELGNLLDDIGSMREWYNDNKDTINTFKNVAGWFGKDGLGLGGKNWQYLLGGAATLGLGYAGYKMMGSDNTPSNAHAAQQRGASPRDPHSSEYEDMMIDMMMRRRGQY